jgi:hypothetical protein
MKIKFVKDLRGRIINQEISPINITLENLLHRLDAVDWDISKLSIYAKKVYECYKLNRISENIKFANTETRRVLVRENILSLYGNDIGDNCLAIYVIAYCVHKYPNSIALSSVKIFLEEENVEKNQYQRKVIANIGLCDGMFLNILDENGIVVDESFLNKWLYARIDNVFNSIITSIEDEEVKTNRFLIYNKIKNAQLDFQSNLEKGVIKQQKKPRLIYKIKCIDEKVALKYLKKRLDLELNIKYANRNSIMRELFQIIENINYLGDFTIYKFDFKHFFESVDSRKVFDRYIVTTNLQRYEKDLLKQLIELCSHCSAGLPTSNAFVEIVASRFDQILKSKFSDKGLCFYARYVDDGILIFNENIDKDSIEIILNRAIEEVFDMPSVKLNIDKTRYLTKKNGNQEFDYLGYHFEKNRNKTDFVFGIADSKIKKCENKLDCIFTKYRKDNDIELLRQRILYYISRIVFYTNTNSRFSTLGKWDENGVIENYCLLRKYIKKGNRLNRNTKNFLFNGILDRCARAGLTHKKMPYFLRGDGKNSYSIAYGLEKNKTIILHPNIGWSTEYLKAQITRLDSEIDLRKKSYRELSKIYYNILKL